MFANEADKELSADAALDSVLDVRAAGPEKLGWAAAVGVEGVGVLVLAGAPPTTLANVVDISARQWRTYFDQSKTLRKPTCLKFLASNKSLVVNKSRSGSFRRNRQASRNA